MAVSTNTLRSGLIAVLVVTSVVALGTLMGGANVDGPNAADSKPAGNYAVQQETAVFEDRIVAEQRGDVAQLSIHLDGTDRATVTIGSPDVNYEVSFTVVDRNGDGEVLVQFNTAVAGLTDDSAGITALGEDDIDDYERTTGPIPGPLDATRYDLELSVDGQPTDVGVLVLNERSTGKMSVWTAPDAARPNEPTELYGTITRTDTIVQGDWAILAIEVSGIFGYVDDADDLNDSANGVNLSVIEDPGRNRPDQPVDLSELSVLPDATNDTLLVLLDTDNLTVGSEYTATFTLDDRNPFVESGETESTNQTFTVVEPTTTAVNETEVPTTDTRTTVDEPTTTVAGTTEELTEEAVVTTTVEEGSEVASAGHSGRSMGLVALLLGVALGMGRRR